jgi:hypothetical protein
MKVNFATNLKNAAGINFPPHIAGMLQSMVGTIVLITVEKRKKRRSLNQNAYYWKVIIPAIHEMFVQNGNDVDEEDVHNYLKEQVGKLSKVILLPDGSIEKIVGSTANLSTMQFEMYVEKCRAFAAQFGFLIKLPNEA